MPPGGLHVVRRKRQASLGPNTTSGEVYKLSAKPGNKATDRHSKPGNTEGEGEEKEEDAYYPPSVDNDSNDVPDTNLSHGVVTGSLEIDQDSESKIQVNSPAEMMAFPVKTGLVIKELSTFCTRAFRESLPILEGVAGTADRIKLKEYMGLFALWGDGCAVFEGELDLLFRDPENNYLRESTVISLCNIAKTLDSYFSSLNTPIYKVTGQDSTNPNSKAASTQLFPAPARTRQPQFSTVGLRRCRSAPSLTVAPRYEVNISGEDESHEIPAGMTKDGEHVYDFVRVRSRSLSVSYSLSSSRDYCEGNGDAEDPKYGGCHRRFKGTAEFIRHQNTFHQLGQHRPPSEIQIHGNLAEILDVVHGLMPNIGSIIEQASDDDPLDLDLWDSIENIKESLDSLFDLVPFIDELYLASGETAAKEPGQARVSTIEPAEVPAFGAQFYKTNIQDKFPNIDEKLAETLAEVNWTRHRRIRGWASKHETQEAQKRPETTFTDSGLGSSNFTFKCPSTSSRKNPFLECGSEVSATSFGTNNSTMSGGIRVPKAPVPLTPGVIFKCCICFKILKGVDTNILWKKHVLRDLQPYSCLFGSCPEKQTTFDTRRAWIAHEFKHHRPQSTSEWRCSGSCAKVYRQKKDFVQHILKDHLGGTVTASDIDDIVDRCESKILLGTIHCPFCPEQIPENKISIQRHIGTHMDEIALKALPQNVEPESNPASEDELDEKTSEFEDGLKTSYDIIDGWHVPLLDSYNSPGPSFGNTESGVANATLSSHLPPIAVKSPLHPTAPARYPPTTTEDGDSYDTTYTHVQPVSKQLFRNRDPEAANATLAPPPSITVTAESIEPVKSTIQTSTKKSVGGEPMVRSTSQPMVKAGKPAPKDAISRIIGKGKKAGAAKATATKGITVKPKGPIGRPPKSADNNLLNSALDISLIDQQCLSLLEPSIFSPSNDWDFDYDMGISGPADNAATKGITVKPKGPIGRPPKSADSNLLNSALDMSLNDQQYLSLLEFSSIFSPSNDWDFDHDMGISGPADNAAVPVGKTFADPPGFPVTIPNIHSKPDNVTPGASSDPTVPTPSNRHYKCIMPGCDKKFRRHSELYHHQNSYHPPLSLPKHLCPIEGCDRATEGNGFSQKDNLRQHLKLKHDIKFPKA